MKIRDCKEGRDYVERLVSGEKQPTCSADYSILRAYRLGQESKNEDIYKLLLRIADLKASDQGWYNRECKRNAERYKLIVETKQGRIVELERENADLKDEVKRQGNAPGGVTVARPVHARQVRVRILAGGAFKRKP